MEHFCAVLHESLNAGENLPPAEGQGEADFVAIRAGMVELNRKLEAAEKKGKGREAALAARDHKIVEMETRLAAKAGDKGSAPAPATAAAATPPPAPGAPKLMKFEAKVEAEVKAGEKPQIPASGVEESILGRGICDALATFWT